jgi:hypothetical protein
MARTSAAGVGSSYGPSISWRGGDTPTCTGASFQAAILGHDDGLSHLLQSLLAAGAATVAGFFALVGFSIRHRSRRL